MSGLGRGRGIRYVGYPGFEDRRRLAEKLATFGICQLSQI
jgi:hypothetical protein